MSGQAVTMQGTGDAAPRANALNFLRIVLAAAVILAHAWNLRGDPTGITKQLGSVAVYGFFGISGYLITASRQRMPFLPFMWRRSLRIFPGYWAALVVTAFVIAPLSTLTAGRAFDWADAGRFVLRDLALVQAQTGIGSTLDSVPFGDWNGSLWTLIVEFEWYLIIGGLLGFAWFRLRAATWLCVILGCVTFLQRQSGAFPWLDPMIARFGVFFLAGAVLHLAGDRVRWSGRLAAAAAVWCAAMLLISQPTFGLLGAVPFAYLLLWLGRVLPLRWGNRNDVSYGLYVYAFPLQQAAIVAGLPALVGPVGFAVLSVAATLPLAWASWLLLERPAMKLRSRLQPLAGLATSPDGRRRAEPRTAAG